MLEQQHQQNEPTSTYTLPIQTEADTIERAEASVRVQPTDGDTYISPLLGSLRKVRKLRHLSVEQLRNQGADERLYPMLCGLLSEASESAWREKILAAWSLSKAELSDKQRIQTAALLCDIIGKYGTAGSSNWLLRLWNAFVRIGKWAAPIIGLGIFASLWSQATTDLDSFIGLPSPLVMILIGVAGLMSLLAPFVIPYSLMVDADHYHEVRAAAVRALRTIGGIGSLDLVAKMALESSPMTSGPARGTLAVLLPQLTPEHYGRMPAGFVADLCRILRYEAAWLTYPHENHTLGFRVVEALEKIGDGHAAVIVEKLLKGSVTPKLREAMERVLPTLQARRAQENAREMLLRGAETPIAAPQELLRPANQTLSQTDPAELVRPVELSPGMERNP
jgi:hypothetical protein